MGKKSYSIVKTKDKTYKLKKGGVVTIKNQSTYDILDEDGNVIAIIPSYVSNKRITKLEKQLTK